MKACSTCKHFSAMGSECRAEPPAVFLVPGPNGMPTRVSAWPVIGDRDSQWCGAHETDLSASIQ